MIAYNLTVKAARLAQVMAAVDAGAGPGLLVIGTAALSGAVGIIASIPLADPSFTVTGAVMSLRALPVGAYASAPGTLALGELRDSNGIVVASGLTVGLAGADIIVSFVDIIVGEYVQVLGGTITHS